MNSNFKKLEFDIILKNLSKHCKTYIGKNLCATLCPSSNLDYVHQLLKETSEAYNLLIKYGNAPIEELEDVTNYIKSVESFIPQGTKSLLTFAKILKISSSLKDYFNNAVDSSSEATEYPLLERKFEALYTNIGVYNSITKSIIDENTISDDASKLLSTLRRNKRRLEATVKDKLNYIIHSSSNSKYIMEPIITIRNDRYVIPVKIEYKDNVKGLIHDISASGSTVYIEPTVVFDLNNEINNIKLEETIEIEHILENLSKQLFPIIEYLKDSLNTIGEIDFTFGKASFSIKLDCIEPEINTDKFIKLIQARHPLIDKDIVVPIDIELGKSFKSLIITGPNTGGKTVTIKTVGLLCLMACSGLHIPAKEGSSIYVFDNVFADIGDEQSIQESLSTFSSHIKNIVNIIKDSSANSLILIDELGSGTDPIQGANLAISILEDFYNKGALTLSTTHYSELKYYALVNEGFENASSEFDIEHLRPTYKILIGVPGKSNAFAISKKLGLPKNILDRASSLMDDNNINIEELLKSIYDNKLEIEREKDNIQRNSNQVELLRKKLENDVSDVECRKKDIIDEAKNEARNILLSAKGEANEIIKDLNNLYKQVNSENSTTALKDANRLRNSLNEYIKDSVLDSTDKASGIPTEQTTVNFSVGSEVWVKPFNTFGTVISVPNKNNDVMVQIGSTRSKINILNLEHTSKKNVSAVQNKVHNTTSKNINLKSKSVSSELNVIGLTVDEAIFIVDKYLDDCYMAGLNTARIVHGKGTGKLRSGIHSFLKTHPHVKSFRLGTFGEGEAGATVVELK